jgi:hypothetical protein
MIKKIIPIIFIILLSGCVKVNSTEQLRRDGSMNVLIVIQSPYFSLTDSINKSIAPNPNITYIIDFMNSSIIYYFPKANLSENDLFISKNESSDLKIEPSGFLQATLSNTPKNSASLTIITSILLIFPTLHLKAQAITIVQQLWRYPKIME